MASNDEQMYEEEEAWLATEEGQAWAGQREAVALREQLAGVESRRRQGEKWAVGHQAEWAEWLTLCPTLMPLFGVDYDFPQFLAEVGPCPAGGSRVGRRDETEPFRAGNLKWLNTGRDASGSPYLTYRQVAIEFNITKTKLYELRKAKKVDTVTVPGLGYRFSRDSLERLMREHTTTADGPTKAVATPSARRRTRKVAQPAGSGFRHLK